MLKIQAQILKEYNICLRAMKLKNQMLLSYYHTYFVISNKSV